MTDTIKQVKVDNWGQFFLTKLQALYTRGEYCDLTLQFHTNESIKVHRLVLNSCTDYFENLLKNNATDHMRLPSNLRSDVVVPIINFMYSGTLEFRPELTPRLYHTAKALKMSILITLLDTHGGPLVQSHKAPSIEPTVVSVMPPSYISGVDGGSPTIRQVSSPSSAYPLADHATVAALMQTPPITSTPHREPSASPNKFITPTPSHHESGAPPKKLSIWKKRSIHGSSHTNSFVTVIPQKKIVEEPARPTRFEWPEDDGEAMPLLYSSTFDDISYDSVPIVKSINNMVKSKITTPSHGLVVMPQQKVMPVATFESVYQSAGLKRPATSLSPSSSRAAKKPKPLDMKDVKEHLQEQEVRKNLIDQEEDLDDFLPKAHNDDYDEDLDAEDDVSSLMLDAEGQSSLNKTSSYNTSHRKSVPKPILKVSEVPSPEANVTKEQLNATGSSKKVRFSLENKVHTLNTSPDGKQVGVLSSNDNGSLPASPVNSADPTPVTPTDTPIVPQNQQTNADEATETLTAATGKPSGDGAVQQATVSKTSSNHAKIIAEVLKKYPHLVKNNKNIRLKIMQRDGQSDGVDNGSEPATKSKVSYMVVKADSCMKLDEEHSGETARVVIAPSPTENTEGPWSCGACGTKETPLTFESYFDHRQHFQNVHNEKFDARICEHCGYKATKRNLLFYHLLTKHNVPPPSTCTFPKCDQCEHYALSETLLAKHRNIHTGEKEKEFICKVCKASFKTGTALQGHIQMKSHWQETKKQAFKCPICHKSFSSQDNLSTHVNAFHKDVPLPCGEAEAVDNPEVVDQTTNASQSQAYLQVAEQQNQHIELPQDQVQETHHLTPQEQEAHMISHVDQHPDQHTTYILPDVSLLAGAQQGTLLQSTEAESLSNVASGIAASLGVADSMVVVEQQQPQTVLYLDKGQLILQTAGGNVHSLPANTHVQEYIVPEIMASDMAQGVGVYTAGQLSQIVQYATGAIQQGEQGILTIVNPNGTIVSPGQSIVQQHEILQQIPVVNAEGNMENMTVVIADHDYVEEEGTLEQNGDGSQNVDVPEGTVNQLPMVASLPVSSIEIPRTEQPSELEIPKLVNESNSEQVDSKVESVDEDSSNAPPVLVRESPTPAESPLSDEKEGDSQETPPKPQTSSASQKAAASEKMAALVRDWDDFDDENAEQMSVNCQPVTEEALPSRPTILLKSDMDNDDLADNLVKIT